MDFSKDYIINILGAPYKLTFSTEKEDKRLVGCVATTDKTSREIVVDLCEEGNLKHIEKYLMQVARHEIVHAFLEESGLGDSWEHVKSKGHDETTIDWFAIQMPKINKSLKEAGLEVMCWS